MQVQLANSPEKITGRVLGVLHEVDLALVAVDEAGGLLSIHTRL
jgi:hypothetical protein